MQSNSPRLLAIIPCYNEADAIGELLKEFRNLPFPCDTLVIDDGSTDNTFDTASILTNTIRLSRNQGVPGALREGIRYAKTHNYDYCIQIDGDGQHIPSEISHLIATVGTSPAHILIGSRYCKNAPPYSGGIRRLAGWAFGTCIYLLFRRQWIHDPMSGMRMMDRKAITLFADSIDNTFMDAAIIPYALKVGFTVREVPVRMRQRLSGTSHVSGIKGITFMLRLLHQTAVIRFT